MDFARVVVKLTIKIVGNLARSFSSWNEQATGNIRAVQAMAVFGTGAMA